MSKETWGSPHHSSPITHYSPLITRHWRDIAGVLLVLVSRIVTMPRTFWESDELLFAAAVRKFDPWSSHPHPPGYPLYVGIGKFVAFLTGDAFHGLVGVSVLSCVIGFLAVAALFRILLGDRWLALLGATILYFSPAML